MSNRSPETEAMKISDVKAKLSSLVNEVYRNERRIVVEKAGIPVAALVPFNDLERLQQFEREWEERFAVVDRMREAFKDIPAEQIERDVVEIIRQLRLEQEHREERWRLLDAMRAPFHGVPPEEIERETTKVVAEVQGERRAEQEAAKKA